MATINRRGKYWRVQIRKQRRWHLRGLSRFASPWDSSERMASLDRLGGEVLGDVHTDNDHAQRNNVTRHDQSPCHCARSWIRKSASRPPLAPD